MKYVTTLLLLTYAIFAMGQKNTNELTVPALVFDSKGDLIISPSSTSSKTDFDFFIGKWELHNKTLKKKPDNTTEWNEFESTQEMYTILNGAGNIDNYISERNGKYFEGMTLRLFNPQTKLWSIYWADSNSGTLGLPPVVGSFENKVGHFFSKDIYDGKTLFTVYRWDARDPNKPVWSQATSSDNGKTWEWNWFMYMRR
jgi:hypothetical protein